MRTDQTLLFRISSGLATPGVAVLGSRYVPELAAAVATGIDGAGGSTLKTGLVLVGGGLANSLIAYRILGEAPDFPLLVLERGPTLGGNHTWSFHDSDLTPDQRTWLHPMVAHSWPRHELRFPQRQRIMEGGYNSVTSDRLQEVVGRALGDRALLGVDAVEVKPDRVRLADGSEITARAVIDGRGDPGGRHLEVGYQKFVGLFVRLAADHGLDGPILMDATVTQRDGYRFVYTLPFSDRELLIEDTYYSDLPQIDREELRRGIHSYATSQGWRIAEVTGEESGVLPIVYGGDIDAFWREGPPGSPAAACGRRCFTRPPATPCPMRLGWLTPSPRTAISMPRRFSN